MIGDRACEHSGDHQADQTGGENGTKGGDRYTPALGDGRCKKAYCLGIKAVKKKYQPSQEYRPNLETAHRPIVDNITYI